MAEGLGPFGSISRGPESSGTNQGARSCRSKDERWPAFSGQGEGIRGIKALLVTNLAGSVPR
jgi:hypothetical protein